MSDLREQKYIVEIAKVQGIAKAAENLFISQPALSKFLSRTEEMYGIQFFERVGKKLIPTYAGEQYLKYAKQIIELDKNFQDQIADIKTMKSGFLAVGSTPGRGRNLFPQILPEFYKKYPKFDLRIYQETANRLEEMLLDGELQVVLMAGGEEYRSMKDFHVEEISSEEICLVASKEKHLKGVYKYGFEHPWLDIRQMGKELFLVLNKGSRLRTVTEKVFRDYGISPKIVEFSSIDTIWEVVSKNFGVALASDFQSPTDAAVDLFSIGTKPVTWKFIAVTRVGGYISVPVQDIIDITKKIYGNQKPEGKIGKADNEWEL